MQKGSAFGSFFGLQAPDFSQASLQRGSTCFGLNVVSIMRRAIAGSRRGRETAFRTCEPPKMKAPRLPPGRFRVLVLRSLPRQARDTFHFRLDPRVDDSGQVTVQPFLQHRLQELAHDPLNRLVRGFSNAE